MFRNELFFTPPIFRLAKRIFSIVFTNNLATYCSSLLLITMYVISCLSINKNSTL